MIGPPGVKADRHDGPPGPSSAVVVAAAAAVVEDSESRALRRGVPLILRTALRTDANAEASVLRERRALAEAPAGRGVGCGAGSRMDGCTMARWPDASTAGT